MSFFDICDKAVVLKMNCISKLSTEALQKIQMRWPHPRGSELDPLSCDRCRELTLACGTRTIQFPQDSTLAFGSGLWPEESLIFGIRSLKIIVRGILRNFPTLAFSL